MNILQKIICFFGIHDMVKWAQDYEGGIIYKCKRCGKEKNTADFY